jgi:hypothetical protein
MSNTLAEQAARSGLRGTRTAYDPLMERRSRGGGDPMDMGTALIMIAFVFTLAYCFSKWGDQLATILAIINNVPIDSITQMKAGNNIIANEFRAGRGEGATDMVSCPASVHVQDQSPSLEPELVENRRPGGDLQTVRAKKTTLSGKTSRRSTQKATPGEN